MTAERKPKRRPSPSNPGNLTSVYTDDQAEWLRACEAFRVRHGLRFLTACDYLEVARETFELRPKEK